MLFEMTKSPEFWRAIAKGIDAEDEQATLFINHNVSIGTARETILKDFLRKRTPEPYRVRSGFVHRLYDDPRNNYCSKQLDVVVYDPRTGQPDYEIADIVVVQAAPGPARLIGEVKTYLDLPSFGNIVDTWNNVAGLTLPVFGFAFDGAEFGTFVKYLTAAIRDEPKGLPDFIAVHRQNYFFVREGYHGAAVPGRHRSVKDHQVAVNFGKDFPGHAAGTLLGLVTTMLKSPHDGNPLSRWFNQLNLPPEAKVSFSDDGEPSYGNV